MVPILPIYTHSKSMFRTDEPTDESWVIKGKPFDIASYMVHPPSCSLSQHCDAAVHWMLAKGARVPGAADITGKIESR